MSNQDLATKYIDERKGDSYPSTAQIIAIRQFAGWLDEIAAQQGVQRTAGTLPQPAPDNQTTIERQKEVNSRRR